MKKQDDRGVFLYRSRPPSGQQLPGWSCRTTTATCGRRAGTALSRTQTKVRQRKRERSRRAMCGSKPTPTPTLARNDSTSASTSHSQRAWGSRSRRRRSERAARRRARIPEGQSSWWVTTWTHAVRGYDGVLCASVQRGNGAVAWQVPERDSVMTSREKVFVADENGSWVPGARQFDTWRFESVLVLGIDAKAFFRKKARSLQAVTSPSSSSVRARPIWRPLLHHVCS